MNSSDTMVHGPSTGMAVGFTSLVVQAMWPAEFHDTILDWSRSSASSTADATAPGGGLDG